MPSGDSTPGDNSSHRVPTFIEPAQPQAPEPRFSSAHGSDLVTYLGALRRGWWLLVLAILIGLGGAILFTGAQTKTYQASTSVLVLPTNAFDTQLTGERGKTAINLDTEAQLVQSINTAVTAKKLLKSTDSPVTLRESVSVTVPPNSAILEIAYTAESPAAARDGSMAFASAYLKNREDSTKTELDRQTAALQGQLKTVTIQLREATAKRAAEGTLAAESSYLASREQNLSSQLNSLSTRINELATVSLTGGKVISEAQLPTTPSHPSKPLNLAAGLMLGLLLGVAAALGWQRTDRRVRRGTDITRRVGVPLLAELTTAQTTLSAPGPEAVFGAFTPAGRMFSRLRNEVMASLNPSRSSVVLVTGASRGPAAHTLAANLAVALAHSGSTVALVQADVLSAWKDMAPAAAPNRLFKAGRGPGLSEVLAGAADLDDALYDAPRCRGLKVLATGNAIDAAGLLQSEAAWRTLSALRKQADYVIVHAPTTAESADAQSLAIHADAVLLAVDLGQASYLEVTDAAAQLERVGTPLLGAVALPTLTPLKRVTPSPRPARAASSQKTDSRPTPSKSKVDADKASEPNAPSPSDQLAEQDGDASSADASSPDTSSPDTSSPDTSSPDTSSAETNPEPGDKDASTSAKTQLHDSIRNRHTISVGGSSSSKARAKGRRR